MSIINGSDILIFDADTEFPLVCQKNVTISMTDNMIDGTCKQSGGFMVNMPGLREFSFTADALVDFDIDVDEIGIDTLFAAYEAKTPINIRISNPAFTVEYYTGLAYINSLEVNAPLEDVVTYTASFTGTFELTN